VTRSNRAVTTKRPYLRSEQRRRQLLDAAGRLFDRGGFGALTMVAVAAESGVSRQLVYDHFSDVAGLLTAFVEDRLARYAAQPELADPPKGNTATAAANFRHLLAIPASDRRIIRLVIADTGMTELDGARQLLLDHESKQARDRARHTRPNRRETAIVWATMSALLSLADAVSNRQLHGDEAEALAIRLVGALHAGQARVPRLASGAPNRAPLGSLNAGTDLL
jgi:AcrR family transcriptional regulator